MPRACWMLLLAAACATTRAPETSPPRFAALTADGLVVFDGERETRVPDTSDLDTFCWTADGRGFVATTKTAIVSVALDGTRRTLFDGWFAVRFPDVAPDGKRFVVSARRRRGEPWSIWVLRMDGTGKLLRMIDGYGPSWSADGNSIYFERYKPRPGLSVLHLDARRAMPFLDDGRLAHTVECAASGRMILFTRGRALTLYEPGSQTVRELTDQRTYNRFPSISPGDRYVLFFRDDPTGETHPDRGIVLRDLTTGSERMLDIAAELAKFAP